MKRSVIIMNECGRITIPEDIAGIWMSETELMELFGVIAPTLRSAIRAIYRSGILKEHEVQKYVRLENGYHFNGSKVDRRFSYSKIDATLQRNSHEERMEMTTKAHEVTMPSTPSGTPQGEFFNGSLRLLNGNGSSYNAADAEVNHEMAEILRRKKNAKRKRGLRL